MNGTFSFMYGVLHVCHCNVCVFACVQMLTTLFAMYYQLELDAHVLVHIMSTHRQCCILQLVISVR